MKNIIENLPGVSGIRSKGGGGGAEGRWWCFKWELRVKERVKESEVST